MIKRIYQLIFVLLFTVSGVMAQTVQIHDVVEEPGVILVPLDMLGFTNGNVHAITLDIEYDSDLLTFSGFENPAFLGIMANYVSNGDFLRITWQSMAGTTINGKLLDLKFSYPGGFSTPVAVTGAEIVGSNLAPIAATFIPGSVTQVTTTNVVSLVDPGLVLVGGTATVPVTIEGPDFGAVNSITLKIAYDPAKLVYAGKVEHAIAGVVASASNDGLLTLNWIGAAQDFTSVATLLDLKFVYNGGGDADLAFYPGSEIADALSPIAVNYVNTVVSPLFGDPLLTLGTVNGTPGTLVTIPIDAADFAGFEVGAITLKIGYDPAKLTFSAYTPYQSIAGWIVSASGGVLSIHRANSGGLTIGDGLLLEVKFMYNGGGLASVEFGPGTLITDTDLETIPVEFENGMVVPADHDATLTLGEVSGTTSFPVVVPITASDFDASIIVGSITLKVGFPAGKLIYTGFTATNPAFSGWVATSTSNQVTLNWSNSGGQLMADGLLVELNFNYPGTGAAPVVFNPGVELYDTDLNLIPISLEDGGVNVTPGGFMVSGYLEYANQANTPLANSEVHLKSSDGLSILETTTTDVDGYYEFLNVADGDYMLDASTSIPWGGVNIFDAIIIANAAPGTYVPGTLVFKVANVNADATVNVFDAIIISNSLPPNAFVPAWTAPLWAFENPQITVSGGDVSVNIKGLSSGDVNASYVIP
ncbi:MAG: hypothetical protein IH597_12500 [Bacteroidales bacterium]|nr:hypothetical protein [Bacteroidales bacterium]